MGDRHEHGDYHRKPAQQREADPAPRPAYQLHQLNPDHPGSPTSGCPLSPPESAAWPTGVEETHEITFTLDIPTARKIALYLEEGAADAERHHLRHMSEGVQ